MISFDLVLNQIANAVNQGKLVPEDVIFGLLSKRLEEGYCRGESGFILDGIPRTRVQAVSIICLHLISFNGDPFPFYWIYYCFRYWMTYVL